MTMFHERPLRVMILESHGSGSHARVIELLKRYSRHSVTDLQLETGHWRSLALTAHYQLAARVREQRAAPDILVLSGGMNVPALLTLLPPSWQHVPRVVYFHESQWTYPAPAGDVRPYLIQHLDAVLVADDVWFNSNHHRSVFLSSLSMIEHERGLDGMIQRVRQRLLDHSRVVYPPVALDSPCDGRGLYQGVRILWNARWENDKRPDRFLALLKYLESYGCIPEISIVGTRGAAVSEIQSQHRERIRVHRHYSDRRAYEEALRGSGVVVSTADHEFFGIGVLEAVLTGSIPVLPDSLAYPETLPSAWFYRPGDIEELARSILQATAAGDVLWDMHRSDAARFLPSRTVPVWDENLERIVKARGYIANP